MRVDAGMHPWERRLADLSHVLESCHATYFSPDLFRQNTNHFLQTARTVTFIIQKNKSAIPNYESWYQQNIIQAWASDNVMTWAKDARNVIEKEGDLETHSNLSLSLVFSYLIEQDVLLQTGRAELLRAGLAKLVRFARAKLPTRVEDVAAVRIERRWFANSLPDIELLKALRYIYTHLHAACQKLAAHLGRELPTAIPSPLRLLRLANKAQRVCYLKLSNLKFHKIDFHVQTMMRGDHPPESIKRVLEKLGPQQGESLSIDSTAGYMTSMAEVTFNEFGNHVPILFLFDEHWHPIDIVSAHFNDQTDKYIFWREVAEAVLLMNVHAISWTCESWVRSMDKRSIEPIRKLPIIGERLHTIVMDRTGAVRNAVWSIERSTPTANPKLQRVTDISEVQSATPFYLVPVMRAFGLPDPPETASSGFA